MFRQKDIAIVVDQALEKFQGKDADDETIEKMEKWINRRIPKNMRAVVSFNFDIDVGQVVPNIVIAKLSK